MDPNLLNPFDVDPTEEYMHEPQRVPNWTEYCYFYGGDERSDYGVSIHIGRDCGDPRIFRGSMAIFLPDGEMLTAMYRGRDGNRYGPGAGPLRVRCIEPFRLWMAEFDGLLHRVPRSQMMNDVFKDSPPEVASFRVLFEGGIAGLGSGQGGDCPQHGPCNGGYARGREGSKTQPSLAASRTKPRRDHGGRRDVLHQGRRHARPFLRCARLCRDHRIRLVWAGVFSDGMSFMAMATRVGANFIKGGFIYRNDGTPLEIIRLLRHAPIADADTAPGSFAADVLKDDGWKSFKLVLGTKQGEEIIDVETRHGIPTTYLSPAHEILGTDFSRTTGGSQMCECPARFRWRGKTGSGMIERIACIPHLRRG